MLKQAFIKTFIQNIKQQSKFLDGTCKKFVKTANKRRAGALIQVNSVMLYFIEKTKDDAHGNERSSDSRRLQESSFCFFAT